MAEATGRATPQAIGRTIPEATGEAMPEATGNAAWQAIGLAILRADPEAGMDSVSRAERVPVILARNPKSSRRVVLLVPAVAQRHETKDLVGNLRPP
jgi:hypothetical protein